jgi:hypothetical protein
VLFCSVYQSVNSSSYHSKWNTFAYSGIDIVGVGPRLVVELERLSLLNFKPAPSVGTLAALLAPGCSAIVAAALLRCKNVGSMGTHNAPMAAIGTALLWVGWFGLGGGASVWSGAEFLNAAAAALNTQVCSLQLSACDIFIHMKYLLAAVCNCRWIVALSQRRRHLRTVCRLQRLQARSPGSLWTTWRARRPS